MYTVSWKKAAQVSSASIMNVVTLSSCERIMQNNGDQRHTKAWHVYGTRVVHHSRQKIRS